MKLLRVIRRIMPRVKLRVIKHLTQDLRDPRVVHKARRARECRKVPVARPYFPEVPGLARRQAN